MKSNYKDLDNALLLCKIAIILGACSYVSYIFIILIGDKELLTKYKNFAQSSPVLLDSSLLLLWAVFVLYYLMRHRRSLPPSQ